MVRTRAALAALLAGCLLAGCSDDDPKPNIVDPTTSVSSTPPVSVSTSPTSSPTSAPTAEVEPRDVVDEWLQAWNVAMTSGDTKPVRSLSTSECASCGRLMSKVEEVYRKGGRYETDGWSATRVSEAPDSREATPSFVMQVVQASRALYGADGELVDQAPKTTIPMRMTFAQSQGTWKLSRLEILE